MRAYGAKIDDALHAIARDPQLGYRRADLPWTYLAYLVGSHIIIYRIGETTIGVLRILPEGLSRPQHN